VSPFRNRGFFYMNPTCKYLARLSAPEKARLKKALAGLLENPPKGDIKPYIAGQGILRLKEGNFRIMFEIQEDVIFVSRIVPRGQAYTRETRSKRG